MYIVFTCPPLPHLIVGGSSVFREGDSHLRRVLPHTFDLIYVTSGRLYMEENKQNFTLSRGQFLILPPNRLHRGTKCCEQETNFYWLHFYTTGDFFFDERPVYDSNVIQKSAQQFAKEEFHVSLPQYGTIALERQEQMAEDMEAITQVRINKRDHTKRFYNSDASQIKQQQLFFSILTYLCDSRSTFEKKDIATDIFEYLMVHYQEPIQLKDLALRYAFHPAHIIRRLKQKYGTSPLQLLLQIRLDKAKQLLIETEKSINEIASQTGFIDSAYFSKQFKKNIHMTPSAYRDKAKENPFVEP